jgi:hypothetical protein
MSRFFDSVFEMPVPFNMVVIIVLIGAFAGLVSTIAKETRKYFCHRNEIELKREMLERGMEPQEIEQIMRATSPKSTDRC